ELVEQTLSVNSIVHMPWLDLTFRLPLNLDPNLYGLTASLILYITLTILYPDKKKKEKWQKTTMSVTTSIPQATMRD
ncbi:MAG: hypothetical protein LPK14_09675, partial [Hymenobacteraceae bacterium]|nr:hypothetical protein [Hymenobacteraceae bacterium]